MDLRLIFAMFAVAFKETVPLKTIETIPPTPGNVLATNYPGLVVRATFEKTTSTNNCGWRYDGDALAPLEGFTNTERFGGLQFHTVGIGCVNRTSSRQSITCVERKINGNYYIISNLTYLQPLTSDLVLAVRCNGGADLIIAVPSKTVRDCPHNFTNGVIASTSQFHFNTTGTFQCNNGGILFYPSGSRPSLLPSHTTCLYTAEWSKQEAIQGLQCWTAPETKISKESILNVTEGENLAITCQYNNVVPKGTLSIIYFNGTAEVIRKEEMFMISSLQIDDDKKKISCQAITPYTQLYNATGRSPNYTINVQYIAQRVKYEVLPGPYLTKTEDGYLLRSDQPLSLNCSSYGNPDPQCNFTICSDIGCIIVHNPQNRCVITSLITSGGYLSCTTFNKAGSRTTKTQSITIVQQTRTPKVFLNGNTTQSDALVIKREESPTLSCSIQNSNDLNTSFSWRTKTGEMILKPELALLSLSLDDTGRYTCLSSDMFGTFSKSVSIEVISAPYQDNSTTCIWEIGKFEVCAISFLSNPHADFVSLMKNGVLVSDFVWKMELSRFSQTFYFLKDQVSAEDNGRYQLILRLTDGSEVSHQIEFDVYVRQANPPYSNASFHVSVSFTAIFAVTIVILTLYIFVKRRKKEDGKQIPPMEPAYAVEGEGNYIEFRTRPSQGKAQQAKANKQFVEEESATDVKDTATTNQQKNRDQTPKVYQNVTADSHYQNL